MQSLSTARQQRHWHILGAGAIGSLFASFFLEAGLPITLLTRSARKRGQKATLQIRRGESLHRYPLQLQGPQATGRIDYLLVCTKAGDVEAALTGLEERLTRHATVVVLANGMGFQDHLRERWPDWRFSWGTTTEGAWREAPLTVCHAGSGETLLGSPGQSVPGWFADWRSLGIRCRWEPEILDALWRKLAINCAINPLTALHQCPNGALLQPPLDAEVAALCEEIGAAAGAAGHAVAVRDLPARVEDVLRGTAANRSSMLQDVLAGRRTELDYLTGFLVDTAERCGVEVPRNRALLETLRRQERAGEAQQAH